MNKKRKNISREELKQIQWQKLKKLLKVVLASNKFYKKKYAKIGIKRAEDIKTLEDFKKLPFTSKKELLEDQADNPLFGTNLTKPFKNYTYVKSTSGTTTNRQLHTLYTIGDFERRAEHALASYKKIVKFEPNDRFMSLFPPSVLIPGTYSFLKKGPMIIPPPERGSDEEVIRKLIDLKVTVFQTYTTKMFHLMESAKENGIDLKKKCFLRKILLGGESGASISAVRQQIENSWGVDCFDWYGSTEIGAIAFECVQKNGLHLIEEETFSEIIDPRTDQEDKKGELIATSLWRFDNPFIRYETGDYVMLDEKSCPCGERSPRLKGGVLGRIDLSIRIRAQSYFPSEFEAIIRKFSEIGEYLIIVKKEKGVDTIEFQIELPLLPKRNIQELLEKKTSSYIGFKPIITVFPKGFFLKQQGKSKRILDRRTQNGTGNVEYGRGSLFKLLIYRSILNMMVFKRKMLS